MSKIDKYFSLAILGLLFIGLFFAFWFYFKYGLVVSNDQPAAANSQVLAVPLASENQPVYRQVVFGVVGDIMLSRNVAAQMKKFDNPLLPFVNMTDWLKSNDFNFGNLESLFNGSDFIPGTNSLVFNAWPKSLAGLVENKFKILSLANNHALDYGLKAINYSRDLLTNQGIAVAGVGQNLDQAWQPALLEINGIKIAFIAVSYTSFNDNGLTSSNYIARWENTEQLNKSIAQAKLEADLVVVSLHAGIEYTSQPSAGQINFAHQAIDQGADLVIGHHPHWQQKREIYKNKVIYYSLGNFIFDQMWSLKTKQGLAVQIIVEQIKKNNQKETSLASLKEYQIIIENYGSPRLDGQPVLVNLKAD